MIILKDDKGNEYQLEFTRKTVMAMENNGFVLDLDKPYMCVESLFYGAFQAHHRRIDREAVRKVWDMQTQKEKLLTALVNAYQKPIEELMAEPEDADPENPTWKET